jgi:hypothetical protein
VAVAIRRVALLFRAAGSRVWKESLHDSLEAAEKEAERLLAEGEAEVVRLEHRLYPGHRRAKAAEGAAPQA